MQITRTMGILISNERNAKQAVRTEENKKVNRGVTASGPGSSAALAGRGAAANRRKTKEKHSAEISFR